MTIVTYNQVSSLALGAAALVLTYSLLYNTTVLGKRPSAVIAFTFGLITYIYLEQNPAVLAGAVQRIAMALVAALVALALSLRRRV